MKMNLKMITSIVIAGALSLMVSCGGNKASLSEKGKLLLSKNWKLDPNATLKGSTDTLKGTTGVTANIELKEDVKAFADFLSETLKFAVDGKDESKLSYSRTIGEGLLSSSVLGYWTFNADESGLILREWDSAAGKEKDPVNYKIVELTSEKLVLLKDGDATPNYYFAK
jgi:hypothetical protein